MIQVVLSTTIENGHLSKSLLPTLTVQSSWSNPHGFPELIWDHMLRYNDLLTLHRRCLVSYVKGGESMWPRRRMTCNH